MLLSASIPLASQPTALGQTYLSPFDPTGEEQELFEAVNRMRMDPEGELDVLFSSLDPVRARDPDADFAIDRYRDPTALELAEEWALLEPVAPLRWSSALAAASLAHNDAMIRTDDQSHQCDGEHPLDQRVINAGYAAEPRLDEHGQPIYYEQNGNVYPDLLVGENIFAYAESAFHAHSAFAINYRRSDNLRPHRTNLMDPTWTDIGISAVHHDLPNSRVGPLVVTLDFGRGEDLTSAFHLLGVVYDDLDGDGVYDDGEGLPGVTITASSPAGDYITETMSAGGYQMPLQDGVYRVTASGGALAQPLLYRTVVVSGQNRKVDFNLAEPPNALPELDLNGPGGDGSGYLTHYVESSGPRSLVAPDLTIDDPDGEMLEWARIRITDLRDPYAESLAVDTSGTSLASSYDWMTGELTLSGADTIASYESVLRSLRYDNAALVPTLGWRTVEVSVSDGHVTSDAAMSLVQVQPLVVPQVAVSAVSATELDTSESPLHFTIHLSEPAIRPIEVGYSARAGTAEDGLDFYAEDASVVLLPGQTEATVIISVVGDKLEEPDETLWLDLCVAPDPSGLALAELYETSAPGTILASDVPEELGQLARHEAEQVVLPDGRRTYRLTAASTGPLSIELASDASQTPGDLLAAIYVDPWDPDAAPVAVSTEVGDGLHLLETDVEAGTSYFLEIVGPAGLVFDWRLLNVIEQDGDVQRIVGTPRDEEFLLDLSADQGPRLAIDGQWLPLGADGFWNLIFDGRGGDDRLQVALPAGGDPLVLDASEKTIAWGDKAALDIGGLQTVEVDAGPGHNFVRLIDTPGDDRFTLGRGVATIAGDGFFYTVRNVESIEAESLHGGDDLAHLYDSRDNDRLAAQPGEVVLSGGRFDARAIAFSSVAVTANAGGYDTACCFDSPGDDLLVAAPAMGTILSMPAVAGHAASVYRITGFDSLTAFAGSGGHDAAFLFDSSRDDVLRARAGRVTLEDVAGEFCFDVRAFDRVEVTATRGGTDRAGFFIAETDGESFDRSEDEATLQRAGECRVLARFFAEATLESDLEPAARGIEAYSSLGWSPQALATEGDEPEDALDAFYEDLARIVDLAIMADYDAD